MAKKATARINLAGRCDKPLKSAKDAILHLDLTVQDDPDQASSILYRAWTAIVLLVQPSNSIPTAQWLQPMALFHKLSRAELERVREAIEMRMRAFERAAA